MPAVVVSMAVALTVLDTGLPAVVVVVYVTTPELVSDKPTVFVVTTVEAFANPSSSKKPEVTYLVGSFEVNEITPSEIVPCIPWLERAVNKSSKVEVFVI